MKKYFLTLRIVSTLLIAAPCGFAQDQQASGVPVSMIVTVQPRRGSEVPTVTAQNIAVYHNRDRAQVTTIVPLQSAGLELFILLDDSSSTSYGTQLDDLRHFILAQPATTKVGVAYMQTGQPKIVQDLTTDHALAANAVRPTLANLASSANPFSAIGDLIEKWPASNDRREILMISNGVDAVFGDSHSATDDPYVDSAIEKAQRAGVVVFAIGTSRQDISVQPSRETMGSEHFSSGKNYLSRVAEETGGESYYNLTSTAPVSFVSYLEDSNRRLSRQYLVTFLAKPGKKPEMQSVRVKTDVPHTELAAAQKVFVPMAP